MSKDLNQPIAILVDLAGPKFRLGDLDGDSIYCARDEEFFLVMGDAQTPNELTTSYEPLVRELSVGDQVMLSDGTVSMVVEECRLDRVRMRVDQQGHYS